MSTLSAEPLRQRPRPLTSYVVANRFRTAPQKAYRPKGSTEVDANKHSPESSPNKDAPHEARPGEHRDVLETKRVWRSEELFGDDNEVLVVHGDLVYRLRRTRTGKLILCK
jgi:hemin uptake protein HemP